MRPAFIKYLSCLILILFVVTVYPGCGYHLVGKGSVLPSHIKIIAIPYLENTTSNVEIGNRITENLSREFSRRGNYTVTGDVEGADAVLQGKILEYEAKPVSFDVESRAERYEIRVLVEVFFRDLTEGELIWENREMAFREVYDVPSGLSEYYDREIEAVEKLAETFAESVVSSITQGF